MSLVFLGEKANSLPLVMKRVGGNLGLILLVTSLLIINSQTVFPGPATLLPVFAAALVILFHQGQGYLSRLLKSKAMVLIGDRSYSIYLWHWPFIVLSSFLWPSEGSNAKFFLVLLSFLFAEGSYRFIEKRFTGQVLQKPTAMPIVVTKTLVPPIALACVLVAGAHFVWSPLIKEKLLHENNVGPIGYSHAVDYVNNNYYVCESPVLLEHVVFQTQGPACHQSIAGSLPSIVLLGDSHSQHLFWGLADALPDINVANYVLNDLPVSESRGFTEILGEVKRTESVKLVILSAYWAQRGVPEGQLAQTVSELTTVGKTVLITDGTPDFVNDAFECKYQLPGLFQSNCERNLRDAERKYTRYPKKLSRIAENSQMSALLPTFHYFCGTTSCSMSRNGRLFYQDSHHLNVDGSKMLALSLVKESEALNRGLSEVRLGSLG